MSETIPTENWPKSHLLKIHAEAIKHGFVWITPISEADANSLRQRCYRIRRRSDKATATFIPPEYHLVTFGKWDSAEGGRIPVIYSARPDGQALPNIVPASGEEISQLIEQPEHVMTELAEMPVQISEADIQIDEEDIGNLVDRMRADAMKKAGKAVN